MATGAGNTQFLFGARLMLRLFDDWLIQIREVKRLRIVTRAAQCEFPFDATVWRLRYYP
jgi:hypothetical protein